MALRERSSVRTAARASRRRASTRSSTSRWCVAPCTARATIESSIESKSENERSTSRIAAVLVAGVGGSSCGGLDRRSMPWEPRPPLHDREPLADTTPTCQTRWITRQVRLARAPTQDQGSNAALTYRAARCLEAMHRCASSSAMAAFSTT